MPTVTARMECVPKWFFVLDMPVFANMQIIDRASGICIKSSSRNSKTFFRPFSKHLEDDQKILGFLLLVRFLICVTNIYRLNLSGHPVNSKFI